ncbi:MAG: ABC transporter substrate-binding protein [Pigmentiphaga sp.]|nr:ABC transporter substrate-binding protein [Pigmentiphaga sp.]
MLFAFHAANAQNSVKVGALRTFAMAPAYYANTAGYFKEEGLDVEFVTLGTGPAIGSAVASGSVQIGHSAAIPVIYARAQNQPFRVFSTLTRETSGDDGALTWLVVSEGSNIRSLKDLEGKTVMTNGVSSLCELAFRDHAANAGVDWKKFKSLTAPFPQMPPAIEIGNADAACVIDPFYTMMRQSPQIKAHTLAAGQIHNISSDPGVALEVLYVTEDWAKNHPETLAKFNRAMAKAVSDFKNKPEAYKKFLVDIYRLDPKIVDDMKTGTVSGDFTPRAEMFSPLIEALNRNDMLKTSLTGQDMILATP